MKHNIAILRYHSVDGMQDDLTISPDAFRAHMDVVSSEYEVVRLTALLDGSLQKWGRERKVIVTFDDAYCDFENALPVLEQLRVPATVFVPTGHIGGFNEWDKNNPRYPRRPIMTEAQLKAVVRTGVVDLGSHSVDHPHMAKLPAVEMHRQAYESKAVLERLLGNQVTMFSYPHGQLGDFSSRTTSCLEQVGYRIAVTTHWGTTISQRDLMRLRRIRIEPEDRPQIIRAKIEGNYDWRAIKENLGFVRRVLKAS